MAARRGVPLGLDELELALASTDAWVTRLVCRDFRDRCDLAGIRVPVLAGIMPVTSLQGMRRMSELAAGARFPAQLLRALDRANGHPEAVERVGIHYAAAQCAGLLDNGVKGIHFYTLNKSHATREIYASLGLLTHDL